MVSTVRDMWYGYEILAENLVDPAHVPFAHHGVGPINRSQGLPFPKLAVTQTSKKGFWGYYTVPGRDAPTIVNYTAPGLVAYYRVSREQGAKWLKQQKQMQEQQQKQRASHDQEDVQKKDSRQQQQQQQQESSETDDSFGLQPSFVTALFLAPTVPGRSRIIVCDATDGSGGVPTWAIPKGWLAHILKLFFLDGDSFFLHAQERMMVQGTSMSGTGSSNGPRRVQDSTASPPATAGGGGGDTPFFATNADRFVSALHQWLSRHAGGGVQWALDSNGDIAGTSVVASTGTPPPLPKDWLPKTVVLDRYSSHVEHCATCQRAVRWLRIAAVVCIVLSSICAVVGFAPGLAAVAAGLTGADAAAAVAVGNEFNPAARTGASTSWVAGAKAAAKAAAAAPAAGVASAVVQGLAGCSVPWLLASVGLFLIGFSVQKLIEQFYYTGYDHSSR